MVAAGVDSGDLRPPFARIPGNPPGEFEASRVLPDPEPEGGEPRGHRPDPVAFLRPQPGRIPEPVAPRPGRQHYAEGRKDVRAFFEIQDLDPTLA